MLFRSWDAVLRDATDAVDVLVAAVEAAPPAEQAPLARRFVRAISSYTATVRPRPRGKPLTSGQ